MKRRSLLILSALVVLFASCGNKDGGNSGLMVPEDASVVVHINGASLSSKLSWDEIRQTNWFRQLSKENTDTMAQQLLENPGSSGVDTKADLVFYLKKHGRSSYGIFTGSLADAGAFEKFAKKMTEDAELKKDGDFNYISSHGGAVVWNKSHFAYASDAHIPDMTGLIGNKGRSADNDGLRSGSSADSLKTFGVEALTVKSGNNLDKDARFASLLKDGSDVHLWFNLGQFYSGMSSMMPMMDLNGLFEGNISALSLNFENGKISAKSKSYFGDKMNKLLANYKAEPVSAAVINRIPSSNVVGVLAFNYSPGIIKEFLKMTGMDALADMFLAKIDFSIDDFIKANKGEVLLAVSDLATVKKEDTVHTGKGKGGMGMGAGTKTDMKVLFATSVKDKVAFEKMVTLIWDLSKKMREGDGMKKVPEINYKLENNWFALSNSAEFTDKFLAGGDNKLPFVDKITGHPVGVYIDLQKIMRFAGSMVKEDSGSTEAAALDASVNMWQDIVARGGDYKDKAMEFEYEVNLVDKNTNSLKQLNQYIDKMAGLRKDKMASLKLKEVTIKEIASKEKMPPPPPKSKKKK